MAKGELIDSTLSQRQAGSDSQQQRPKHGDECRVIRELGTSIRSWSISSRSSIVERTSAAPSVSVRGLAAVGPYTNELDAGDAESDGNNRDTNLFSQRYCARGDLDQMPNVQRPPCNIVFDTLESHIHLVFDVDERCEQVGQDRSAPK